jgi:hypothetical protein
MGIPFTLFTPDNMQTSFGNLTLLFPNGLSSGVSVYHGRRFLGLGVTNGKVSVGGSGNKRISFTFRPDIARYPSYVLMHLPAEQLNYHFFMIAETLRYVVTNKSGSTSPDHQPESVIQ